MSCRNISKILEKEVLTPTDYSAGFLELSISTEFPVTQLSLNSNSDLIAITDAAANITIFKLFFGENSKLKAEVIHSEKIDERISQIYFGGNFNLFINSEKNLRVLNVEEVRKFVLRHPDIVQYSHARNQTENEGIDLKSQNTNSAFF